MVGENIVVIANSSLQYKSKKFIEYTKEPYEFFNPDLTTKEFIKFSDTEQKITISPGIFDTGYYKVFLTSKTSDSAAPVDLIQQIFIQVIPDLKAP